MGKKNKKLNNYSLNLTQKQDKQIEQVKAQIAEEEKSKKAKNKNIKKTKKTNPNKRKFGTGFKETVGELKKVAWPSFGKVVKTTGVVLAVVGVFTLVLLGIDLGLEQLHKLLVK